MFAANENMECDVYIPDGQIAPGKLSQAYQFGTQMVIKVNGNFDDAFLQNHLDAANEEGSYTVNSVNPFRIEGPKNNSMYRAIGIFKLGSSRLDSLSWRCTRKYFKLW